MSICDFKRAVDNSATVPLYYENRGEKLRIDNPDISDELLAAVAEADLDVNEKAKVELELRKDIRIITASPRLEEIANHYTSLWTTGIWKEKVVRHGDFFALLIS